jgi:hypothetical protein
MMTNSKYLYQCNTSSIILLRSSWVHSQLLVKFVLLNLSLSFLCSVFCRSLFVFLSFCHYIVSSTMNYAYWLPLFVPSNVLYYNISIKTNFKQIARVELKCVQYSEGDYILCMTSRYFFRSFTNVRLLCFVSHSNGMTSCQSSSTENVSCNVAPKLSFLISLSLYFAPFRCRRHMKTSSLKRKN